MRRVLFAITVATITTVGADTAAAQTRAAHVGPHLLYNFDIEEFGIGAQLGIPIGRRFEFYPSFDYYFVDPGSAWGLNADLKYRLGTAERLQWLYVGSGLGLRGVSYAGNSETDAGLNLFGGAESLSGRIHPFGEARLTLSDGSSFQIAAGINITLGGSR